MTGSDDGHDDRRGVSMTGEGIQTDEVVGFELVWTRDRVCVFVVGKAEEMRQVQLERVMCSVRLFIVDEGQTTTKTCCRSYDRVESQMDRLGGYSATVGSVRHRVVDVRPGDTQRRVAVMHVMHWLLP